MQAALDACEAALRDARPIYESAKGIVNSHQWFNENSKVTDAELPKETVQAMRENFRKMKDAMKGTAKVLRKAIKAFREANPRPQPTPTKTNG